TIRRRAPVALFPYTTLFRSRLYWRYARDLVTALEWSAGVGRAVRDLAAANRVDVIVAPEVQASAFHVSRDKPAPLLVTCHAPHRVFTVLNRSSNWLGRGLMA